MCPFFQVNFLGFVEFGALGTALTRGNRIFKLSFLVINKTIVFLKN